jgi:hypothetical protein
VEASGVRGIEAEGDRSAAGAGAGGRRHAWLGRACGRAVTAQALPGSGAALSQGVEALVAVAGGLRRRRRGALPLLCHGRGQGQSRGNKRENGGL